MKLLTEFLLSSLSKKLTRVLSVVVGLIVGWWYKDSKVLSLIISAVTGG